jgi:hypothetical protein
MVKLSRTSFAFLGLAVVSGTGRTLAMDVPSATATFGGAFSVGAVVARGFSSDFVGATACAALRGARVAGLGVGALFAAGDAVDFAAGLAATGAVGLLTLAALAVAARVVGFGGLGLVAVFEVAAAFAAGVRAVLAGAGAFGSAARLVSNAAAISTMDGASAAGA